MPVMVNGKKVVTGSPGSYVTINRQWKDGDIISFTLPMGFRMTKYEGEEQIPGHERYALEYGPLLMGYTSKIDPKGELPLPVEPGKLVKQLKPVPDVPLHFTIGNNADCEYVPYFEIQDKPFTCFPLFKKL
jgi:hypothetical protein